MDVTTFDSLTESLTTGTTRRHAVAGLGALALGAVGVLGLRSSAAAESKHRCEQRCNDQRRNGRNARSRDRCRRRCENR